MDSLFSRTVKAGKTTYFIDVKEAKNKSKYILIAESTLSQEGENNNYTRRCITIFDTAADQVSDAYAEALNIIRR